MRLKPPKFDRWLSPSGKASNDPVKEKPMLEQFTIDEAINAVAATEDQLETALARVRALREALTDESLLSAYNAACDIKRQFGKERGVEAAAIRRDGYCLPTSYQFEDVLKDIQNSHESGPADEEGDIDGAADSGLWNGGR